ncbi:MAG: hypothetical protein JW809_00125 [Pirellulales bacterium]|nr:hypothetical protein [Pirellulales bacterium]
MNKQDVIDRMCASGILPVFRTDDARHLLPATKAFYDAGIACVEYTTTMPNSLGLVEQGAKSLPGDLLLGLGTARDGETVERAARAGAKFIASPGCEAKMIEACQRHGLASVVGAMTPNEIMEAVRLGADVIKIFPADCVGPTFFSSVLGPLPGLCLMAAGGMTLENVGDYVTHGADVVTFLANGLEPAAYAAGDCQTITRTAARWVEAVRAARARR